LTVADAEALAAGLNALSDPEKQSAMGAAAQAALRPQADARELVGAITQRLDAAS
ncbi:3-deoxy-D-manno-octulosonic acid transferase, partial [Salipiger sp. HF18]|nr:3-deoxy-D-manno-octulosonic acid transferase [Salipiger sp. HF18]